jgi:hypothetical protein
MVDPVSGVLMTVIPLSAPFLHSLGIRALDTFRPPSLKESLKVAQENLLAVMDIIEDLSSINEDDAQELLAQYSQ